MKKQTIAALCALAVGASLASAEPPNPPPPGGTQIQGSDTLREIAIQVLSSCGINDPNPVLNYVGGGSTAGGDGMRARNQQVAPQSRFLSTNECDDFGAHLPGEGVAIGLDGLATFGDNTEETTCTTIRYTGNLVVTDRDGDGSVECPNCSGNTYTFSDWRDVLRIVYGGQSAHISHNGCSDADPTRSAVALRDCESDLRAELVASWGNLFQGGCSDSECALGLRHAFRRDDASGTTDTFLTLLALPAVAAGTPLAPQRTFCNGLQNEDNDPIRRTCDSNEQVCAAVPFAFRSSASGPPAANTPGDLGLVLPVSLPEDLSLQYDDDFTYCSALPGGTFKLAPMPTALLPANQRCPDGNVRTFNQCRWPVDNAGTPANPADDKFNCLARQNNRPGSRTFANMDARAYNLIPRHPTTGAILLQNPAGIGDPRWGGGGWYRMHEMAPLASGDVTCREADATQQIGCLVTASPCSIGFAGLEAGTVAINKAFNMRSPLFPSTEQEVAALPSNVRRLLDPVGGTCNNGEGDDFGIRYPLSRRLYFNAARGFGMPSFSNITNVVDSADADTTPDLTTLEQDWAVCFTDRTITDQAIVATGFITLTPTNCSTGGCSAAELDINYRARACMLRCGNGITESGEVCDDGNTVSGDRCSANCQVAQCGTGSSPACGGRNAGDACSPPAGGVCTIDIVGICTCE